MTTNREIGQRLEEARLRRGMSRRTVAKHLARRAPEHYQLTDVALRQIELGQRKGSLSPVLLILLADVYDTPLADLSEEAAAEARSLKDLLGTVFPWSGRGRRASDISVGCAA